MKLGGISNLGVKLRHGVDHVVDWSVSFTQKAIDQYVGRGSYDVGVVHHGNRVVIHMANMISSGQLRLKN